MSEKLDFTRLSVHDTPKQSPGFLLWHISTTWRSSIEAVLKILNLTHPQFVVLASVGWLTKNEGSTTQATIGKFAGLDPNTTSQILKGLEQKGLVFRVQSSDARAKNASLTPAGSKVLQRALPAVEKADAEFFSCLDGTEITQLIAIFQKLIPLGSA